MVWNPLEAKFKVFTDVLKGWYGWSIEALQKAVKGSPVID
jgi:hypothetical protein